MSKKLQKFENGDGKQEGASLTTSRRRSGKASNGIRYEQPFQRLEGESDEEREKRLKKREALSLKVMRMAYENYQKTKWSR